MQSGNTFYIAYGSNVLPERLTARNIRFRTRHRALIPDHRLVFNIKDQRDSRIGYANIEKAIGTMVEAALYEIEEEELRLLDRFEQEYTRTSLQVIQGNKSLKAHTYIGKEEWISPGLKPPSWYLEYFLKTENFFSREYYDFLRGFETVTQKEDNSLDGEYL